MPQLEDLHIIGDRVLIKPDSERRQTHSGLYLPQGVATKEKMQQGSVMKTGPGYIVPVTDTGTEPWQQARNEPHYVALQVKVGDYAIFLRREAIEIEFLQQTYMIVPHAAILAAVRENLLPA